MKREALNAEGIELSKREVSNAAGMKRAALNAEGIELFKREA
jgi:hypothetical protein